MQGLRSLAVTTAQHRHGTAAVSISVSLTSCCMTCPNAEDNFSKVNSFPAFFRSVVAALPGFVTLPIPMRYDDDETCSGPDFGKRSVSRQQQQKFFVAALFGEHVVSACVEFAVFTLFALLSGPMSPLSSLACLLAGVVED